MEDEIKYYIYARVNGSTTDKYDCEDFTELYEIFHNQLADNIEEELLYQSIKKTEEI